MRRLVAASLLLSSIAGAQDAQGEQPPAPASEQVDARFRALEARVAELEAERAAREQAPSTPAPPAGLELHVGGWVEAYYAWNFNQPSNGITDLRGFDNRHNSFNVSTVALDGRWDWQGVNGRVTLQFGSTPSTYYLAEPSLSVAGSATGPQGPTVWQFLQQAYVGYRIPIGGGLNVQAGLFLAPTGIDRLAVRYNWFYSRNDLCFGLPFYHTGVRATYTVGNDITVAAWLINGWNTVLDNNDEKSFILQAAWRVRNLVAITFNYVSGVERPPGAPEGRAWRHVFDLNGQYTPVPWLGVQWQVSGGFEPGAFGTEGFFGAMLAAHSRVTDWLGFALRGDFFWDRPATNAAGSSSPIFWPVEWVGSFTADVSIRVEHHVAFKLEYRHDHAAGSTCTGGPGQVCAYYAGAVPVDAAGLWIRNASSQDTITLGTTAWF